MAVGARPLVPSRLRPGGVGHSKHRQPTTVIGGYVTLMKLRVVELLLISTLPTMVLAEQGWPSTRLVLVTLLGGTLAAGGANAINMVIDRDIDALMERTKGRPTVTGLISPTRAMVFAITLELLAFAVLWSGANLLAAVLACSAMLFYVFVYTLWLKRSTRQNIVIGGAAGAMPVLVGWAAVRDSLGWAPVVLFWVILLWTPPHTWALAFKHAHEYRAADVPMLPAVASPTTTVNNMIGYSVAMVLCSLAVPYAADLGTIYWVTAVVCGVAFIWSTVDLRGRLTPSRAMRVFGLSITYITLLFGAIMVDVFVRHGF